MNYTLAKNIENLLIDEVKTTIDISVNYDIYINIENNYNLKLVAAEFATSSIRINKANENYEPYFVKYVIEQKYFDLINDYEKYIKQALIDYFDHYYTEIKDEIMAELGYENV